MSECLVFFTAKTLGQQDDGSWKMPIIQRGIKHFRIPEDLPSESFLPFVYESIIASLPHIDPESLMITGVSDVSFLPESRKRREEDRERALRTPEDVSLRKIFSGQKEPPKSKADVLMREVISCFGQCERVMDQALSELWRGLSSEIESASSGKGIFREDIDFLSRRKSQISADALFIVQDCPLPDISRRFAAAFADEACRQRSALLDFANFLRRKYLGYGSIRSLVTSLEILCSWISRDLEALETRCPCH